MQESLSCFESGNKKSSWMHHLKIWVTSFQWEEPLLSTYLFAFKCPPMYLVCSHKLYSSFLQWEELPELSASIMYLAESQVALISQQARWQHCVGSACGRGAVRRGPAASWREDCSHPGSLSAVPVQLCFSLQLELLICSICGRGQRVKQNTCLVAEAWQAGAACSPL